MYLAIEWTSAALHIFRLDADGTVLDERRSARGVNTVTDGGFEAVLRAEAGGWLVSAEKVLLSGMITSRNGWVETPYADLPAGAGEIAAKAVRQDIAGLPPLLFLPGAAQTTPLPDVMRGEELSVLATGLADAVVVLPGQHTKWVVLQGGRITGLTTYLSGEILGFLKTGSIVSKLIAADAADDREAFRKGVTVAADETLPGGILRRLFSGRSLVLFDAIKPQQVPSYLDGLVIGAEIREAVETVASETDICLVGQSPLAELYVEALTAFGRNARIVKRETARGFAAIAAAS